MAGWDQRDAKAQARSPTTLLRAQLRDAVGPFSPFWRERLAALRVGASSIQHVADLRKLPAVGERDVCPDGDPRGAAAAGAAGRRGRLRAARHGPDLRKALVRRVLGKRRPTGGRSRRRSGRRRTTSAGQALHLPGRVDALATSTSIARAGNRAWQVLGLTPRGRPGLGRAGRRSGWTTSFADLAALGAGAPALFPARRPGPDGRRRDAAAGPGDRARRARDTGAPTCSPTLAAGGRRPRPAAHRVCWSVRRTDARARPPSRRRGRRGRRRRDASSRCTARPRAGSSGPSARRAPGSTPTPTSTIVELVDPESGETLGGSRRARRRARPSRSSASAAARCCAGGPATSSTARSRTDRCRHCQRTVPRVPSRVRTGRARRTGSSAASGEPIVDLRAVAGALAGRPDLAGWRIEVGPSGADGARRAARLRRPHAATRPRPRSAPTATSGRSPASRPTQVVVVSADELARRGYDESAAALGTVLSPRIVVRR